MNTGELINEGTEEHDFGVVDDRGRAIGARVRFWVRVVGAGEKVWSSAHGAYLPAGTTWYAIHTSATRAGQSFGASQSAQFYGTEQERAAASAKYLAGASKRATSTAARV